MHNSCCFVREATDVLVKVDNRDDFKLTAEKLRREFDKLLMKVQNTQKTEILYIRLHDVKRFINRKLHSIYILEEQRIAKYQKNFLKFKIWTVS